MYYVDIDSCSGCGACADTCPVGAISIRECVACIDDKTCNACGRCLDVCPADAILVLEMVPETGSVTAMEPRTTRRPAPASVTGAVVTDPGATAPSGRALVGRVLSGLLAIATLALEREGRIHGGSAGSPADRHSSSPLSTRRERGLGRRKGRRDGMGRAGGAKQQKRCRAQERNRIG